MTTKTSFMWAAILLCLLLVCTQLVYCTLPEGGIGPQRYKKVYMFVF